MVKLFTLTGEGRTGKRSELTLIKTGLHRKKGTQLLRKRITFILEREAQRVQSEKAASGGT